MQRPGFITTTLMLLVAAGGLTGLAGCSRSPLYTDLTETQAKEVLASAGLPRQSLRTLGDVFPKESFVSSPLEERARYIFALSQEVQQTLMQLDGIVDARVHIALPERSLLDD